MRNNIKELEKKEKQRKEKIWRIRQKEEGKEETGKFKIRIGKLEANSLLLFNQISMFQTSRYIFKSIYHYYYNYLNLNKVCI